MPTMNESPDVAFFSALLAEKELDNTGSYHINGVHVTHAEWIREMRNEESECDADDTVLLAVIPSDPADVDEVLAMTSEQREAALGEFQRIAA